MKVQDVLAEKAAAVKAHAGDYGVEVEMEGGGLHINCPPNWRSCGDGSLRGGREFVMRVPRTLDHAKDDIGKLYKRLKDEGAHLDNSIRCGVHVHINMQQHTLLELYTFFAAFTLLETYLTGWCGTTRRGNHFCLRAKDATALIDYVTRLAVNYEIPMPDYGQMRYSAFNITSLAKYGSVEIRCMNSPNKPARLYQWLDILHTLKNNSIASFKTPRELVEEFSRQGPEKVVETLLGEHVGELVKFNDKTVAELRDAMWLVQDFAYEVDWEAPHFKGIRDKLKNPFELKPLVIDDWAEIPRPRLDRVFNDRLRRFNLEDLDL